MRFFILVLIILLFASSMYSIEPEITSYDSIQYNKIENLSNSLAHNQSKGNKNFILHYQSIIASFIGAFFAGLIAFCSIKATNKSNILSQTQKEAKQEKDSINKYCGLIYAVNVSLILDQNMSSYLERQISEYIEVITYDPEVKIDYPFTKYSISFTKACQIDILKFHNFNFEILTQLSYYISKIETLNENLNLHNVNKVRNNFRDEKEYISAVNQYFISVKELMKESKEIRDKLKLIIRKDIESFPTTNVFFDDIMAETDNT